MCVPVGSGPLLCVAWADDNVAHRTQPGIISDDDRRTTGGSTQGRFRAEADKSASGPKYDDGTRRRRRHPRSALSSTACRRSETAGQCGCWGPSCRARICPGASQAWTAFHLKAPLWRMQGSLHARLQILHLSGYASFEWASGTGRRTAGELQRPKAMQVRMIRRVAGWFPQSDEDWASFAHRCSAWSQNQWPDMRPD